MDKKFILDFDKKQKSLKHKKSKYSDKSSDHKAKQAKIETPEVVQPSISYRDRAKERRERINKDFELDPDDIIISNPIVDTQIQDDDPIDEAERKRQQIEDSKYLGGDVEHTHLVKGLDFALLEKVKNDQKLVEKLGTNTSLEHDPIYDDQDDQEDEELRNEALLAASASASSKRQLADIEKLRKGKSTELIPCRTTLARRILNVLDEKWPKRSELFLPGRMSYIIPIDEDCDDNTVTTILKSKADTSIQDESGLTESDFALDQLVNILAKIRKGQSSFEYSKKTKNSGRTIDMNDYDY